MTDRQVKCPHCGRFVLYSMENKFRPFCSERCRLIDLGQWASESYRIAQNNHHVDYDEEKQPKDESES